MDSDGSPTINHGFDFNLCPTDGYSNAISLDREKEDSGDYIYFHIFVFILLEV